MRIALNGWFWDHPNTGSGRYLRRLSAGLARLYPESEFVVLYPGESAPGGLSCDFNVTFVPAPISRGHLGKVWWEQVQSPWLARRIDADLFHVPYWASPWHSALPTTVTIHDLIPLLLPAYRRSVWVRLYTALVRSTATRAAFVLTDSESAKADIVRYLHIPKERVRVTYLAADVGYGAGAATGDAKVLATQDLSPGYLLYCGGFDVRKNLRTVLAAFARVRKVATEARLVLVGRLPSRDSAFHPDPRRLAGEVGVPGEALHFTGFVPDVDLPALYRGARGLVFPSFYEGFGLPALEAMACGVPVVAGDVSSLPEVVGDGGILVPPSDVDGMADALLRILEDDTFHAEVRSRALRQATRFSWEATARATWDVYEQVLLRRCR